MGYWNIEWQELRDNGCICDCLNYDVDNRRDNSQCPHHHPKPLQHLPEVVESFVELYGRAVHQCAVDHGWWDLNADGERNMGEMLMLMVSELAEGLEAWRDGEPMLYYTLSAEQAKEIGLVGDQKWEGPPDIRCGDSQAKTILGKPCGLASELADTIIRILDTCVKMGIPLTKALVEKYEYNLTRPYRHGGKLA